MNAETNKGSERRQIDAELKKEIEQLLTPKRLEIFKIVAAGGEVAQGDIARISKSTAPALSNQLYAFNDQNFKLLEMRVKGRRRYYRLSELGGAYAELLGIVPKDPEGESAYFLEAKAQIEKFRQKDQWESHFNKALTALICGRYAELDKLDEEERELVGRYLRCVELLILEGDEVALEETMNLLPDRVLQTDVEDLMEYFRPFTAVLAALRPERDPFNVYMLVKAAFSGEDGKAHEEQLRALNWENGEYGKLQMVAEKLKEYLATCGEWEIYQYFNKLLPDRRELSLYIAWCICEYR